MPDSSASVRIFIAGLSPVTTEDSLCAYFEKWGTLENVVVKQSPEHDHTYGFVTIMEENIAQTILSSTHMIDDVVVQVERAKVVQKDGRKEKDGCKGDGHSAPLAKVFVGGLSHQTTEKELHEYFSKFGELTDVVVMMSGQGPDRHPRGFGFVTFANPAALDLVGCQRYHSIGNRKVEVKRALSREVMQGVKASAVPESVERHMAANAGWQPHAPLNAPANTAIYGTMQQGVYDNNHAYINNSGWVQPTCGAPRLQALAMMPVGLPTSVPAIMPVGVPIDNGYMPPSYMGYAPVVDDGYMPPHMGYAPMKAGTMTTMAPPSPTMVVNGDGYVSPHMGYAPIKVGTMTTMAPPSPTMVVYSTGMMC